MTTKKLAGVAVNGNDFGRDLYVVIEQHRKWLAHGFPAVHLLGSQLDDVNRLVETVGFDVDNYPTIGRHGFLQEPSGCRNSRLP